jgi:FkbM family methyltransferase
MKTFIANCVNRILGTVSLQLLPKINIFELQKALLTRAALNGKEVERPVIFDLGASDGERTTKKYQKLFRDAQIYSFEPDQERFTSLQLKNLKNVASFQLAVSDEDGETSFYCNEDADTNSLFEANTLGSSLDKFTRFKREFKVRTMTLDSFCRSKDITEISILKMDIQGAELKALRGASDLLKGKRIGLIYLEVEFVKIYQDQPLYHDVAGFLEANGYDLYGIYNLCSIERRRLAWGDAIFLPRADHVAGAA